MKLRCTGLFTMLCGLLAAGLTACALVTTPGVEPSPTAEVGGAATSVPRAAADRNSATESAPTVALQILAFNDFHGQITAGRTLNDRPVGSAPVLAAYLRGAALVETTILVHAGDLVGASPPRSGLFQDEPTVAWLNLLANTHCGPERRMDPRCNVIGIPGNHEFDEGLDELLRLVRGGNHKAGPFLENLYSGAHFPTICANLVDVETGAPVLPPFVIKTIDGVPVGFIGAVVKDVPTLVNPSGVKGYVFLDEATAINGAARRLRSLGVETLIAVIHQGGRQEPYTGDTRADAPAVRGEIVDLVADLDDGIDVVISGHTHEFTNAFINTRHGVPILITQAYAKSAAYADIDLVIDRGSRDVIRKSARIVPAWADAGPGLTPDAAAAALLAEAERRTAPLVERRIAEAAAAIGRAPNAAGETALGELIADAQRRAMGTDFALMNPGGIRSDLDPGPITWGDCYAAQPFGNAMVSMQLSGEQLYRLLNQQWAGQPRPRVLQVSGLTYVWDEQRPDTDRIVEIRKDGRPIEPAAFYSVAVNEYLAAGGDRFTVFTEGRNPVVGGGDLDVLIEYLQQLPQPVTVAVDGRICRLH